MYEVGKAKSWVSVPGEARSSSSIALEFCASFQGLPMVQKLPGMQRSACECCGNVRHHEPSIEAGQEVDFKLYLQRLSLSLVLWKAWISDMTVKLRWL